jgi:hypothetical protein
MAVSRDTEHERAKTFWDRVFTQLTRYDLVVTAIPLVFAIALLASVILSVSLPAALTGSAVLSIGLVTDALFINPPMTNS